LPSREKINSLLGDQAEAVEVRSQGNNWQIKEHEQT